MNVNATDIAPVVTIRRSALDEVVADSDVEQLATLHVALAEAKRVLGDHAKEVERRLAEVMTTRKVELDGLPVLERKPKSVDEWDSEGLANHLARTYSITDLLACLPLTKSLGWRATALRELGVDLADYRTRTPNGWSVQIHQAPKENAA